VYVVVGVDSEANHYEFLSGKDNINCVNCILLNVKPHTRIEICTSNYCSSTRRYTRRRL
jgi:hypothetical protein